MFNMDRLKEWVEKYKNTLTTGNWWADEKYKWEAVKCFHKNWDIEAENFEAMLKLALKGTGNLLFAGRCSSNQILYTFAKKYPEKVREMFRGLFDERRNLYERIAYFKQQSKILQDKCGQMAHYQNEHAITIYLWLRYPSKYYIYKISILKNVASVLESEYTFRNGAYKDNINKFMPFYDEICEALQKDKELKDILASQITDKCYPDSELKTLTSDFGYFIDKQLNAAVTPSAVASESGSDDMVREDNSNEADDMDRVHNPYTKKNFLSEVYLSEEQYVRLKSVLMKKKNIILQGAPGVGKTFAAKRLAYSIMEKVDEDRIEIIQFHQSYSYEDFMMGYKPSGNGFELKEGIFYKFCKKAEANPDKDYFFIIDEINRGNMSKIFGELLMLIETDYRNKKITLAYDGREFSVPENLYIIGLMNTADRSLAMIDYALRRRFSFFNMEPGFDSSGFRKYQEGFENEAFGALIDKIKELNQAIADDPSLGKGFCIGHSYFCNAKECTEAWMREIVDFDILPMLREYWIDDSDKYDLWENNLQGVFQ